MASINNVSTRSQLRTNIPGDIRVSGRVAAADATPSLAGKGFTFLPSGVTGLAAGLNRRSIGEGLDAAELAGGS